MDEHVLIQNDIPAEVVALAHAVPGVLDDELGGAEAVLALDVPEQVEGVVERGASARRARPAPVQAVAADPLLEPVRGHGHGRLDLHSVSSANLEFLGRATWVTVSTLFRENVQNTNDEETNNNSAEKEDADNEDTLLSRLESRDSTREVNKQGSCSASAEHSAFLLLHTLEAVEANDMNDC